MKWNLEFGPASVIGFFSMLIQIGVVVWVASSVYTGLTNKIEAQGTKIEQVEKGSDKRFETVYGALKESKSNQVDAISRVSSLETAIRYIGTQIERVQAKLDAPAK
jgi:hypothetical protein